MRSPRHVATHALASVLALAAACGAPALVRVPVPPQAPPVVEPLAAPLTFGPVAHPAAAYDEPLEAAPDAPADAALRAALAVRAGDGVELLRDGRLDVVAGELAEIAARGANLSAPLVEFALEAHGVVERGHAFVGRGAPATDLAAFGPALAEQLSFPNTRAGVHVQGDLAVVVIVHTIPVHFVTAPREVRGDIDLAGVLAAPYRSPRITITRDDRTTEALAVTVRANGEFHAPFRCRAYSGTQWVAVEADQDPAPLAVVPISCGQAPPATFRIEPAANLATADLEKRIAAMVNRERIAAHLPPLLPDGPTALAARAYAETMRAALDVAHDLGDTTPASRLAAAGRAPSLVSETTLKADDLGQATEILLNDRAYRAQVVDPSPTHVGVGVALGTGGELFLAIEYIQLPPPIDTATIEAAATAQLLGAHRTRRAAYDGGRGTHRDIAAPPAVDGDLTKLARTLAADIATGWSNAAAMAWLQRKLADERRYTNVGLRVVQLTSAERFDVHALLPAGQIVDNIGVGCVQAGRDGPSSGRIWLVVTFAHY